MPTVFRIDDRWVSVNKPTRCHEQKNPRNKPSRSHYIPRRHNCGWYANTFGLPRYFSGDTAVRLLAIAVGTAVTQLGLASPLESAASQSGQTNNPSAKETGQDASHHTHVSPEGRGKNFFLDILFHGMSANACQQQSLPAIAQPGAGLDNFP
jgi:hypothetical protein